MTVEESKELPGFERLFRYSYLCMDGMPMKQDKG